MSVKSVLHLGRTMRLVWSIAPGWTLASIALAVVQGVLPLASAYMIGYIVDAVAAGVTATDKDAAFAHVAWLIFIAGLIGLAAALARSLAALVTEAQGQVITDHISDLIHAKSIAVDLEYYENSKYYDVLHRAQQEAPYRPARIVSDLMTVGQSTITVIGVIGMIFSLNWLVGVIVVAAALPSAYVRFRYSSRMYQWQRRSTVEDRRSWYLHTLLTDGTYAKELRLFHLGDTLRDWFHGSRDVLRGQRLSIAARRSFADLASQAIATVAVFGTFAYIAWRTIGGTLSLGDMMRTYYAFSMGLGALQSALGGVAGLYEDNLFLTYYHDFMQLEPRVVDPPSPRPLPRPMREGVVFEAVDFHYPDTERTALTAVDLHIRPGEVTALVGPNGSGKTTLVKLLCRLYDPQEGRVTSTASTSASSRRSSCAAAIGVIFQDFAKYQLTARQNIWTGNVALPEDDPAVERAARDAGAHDVIRVCGRATTRCSASGSKRARSSRSASGRRSPWRARSCATPTSSSSTSRRAPWTRCRSGTSSNTSASLRRVAPSSSSATGSRRCATPTASTSSTRGASSRAGRTTSSWRSTGSTRACTRCRRARTGTP